MDDVARGASMSKKTLYQYFDNKDHLVYHVVMHHFKSDTEEFQCIVEDAKDAVHEVLMVAQCMRRHVFKMNPSLLFDMQRFHASAWDEYLNFKHSVVKGMVKQNLEKGMKEGYFRSELDPEIIANLRVEQVQLAFDRNVFPPDRFELWEVHLQIMDHFVQGLLTEKGRAKYLEHIKSESLTTYANK